MIRKIRAASLAPFLAYLTLFALLLLPGALVRGVDSAGMQEHGSETTTR